MLNHNIIGGKKTNLQNMMRGVAGHDRGNMKKAYDNLLRQGFFISEVRGEPYFSLNPIAIEDVSYLIRLNRCPKCNSYLQNTKKCTNCNYEITKEKKEELEK